MIEREDDLVVSVEPRNDGGASAKADRAAAASQSDPQAVPSKADIPSAGELLHCPMCGGAKVLTGQTLSPTPEWYAACNRDQCVFVGYFSSREEAVTAWNTRAPQSAGLSDAFRPMDEWDQRDELVLLLVDYRDGGAHPLENCGIGLTIGHNHDHNTPGEGKGWQFAGWCWSHDHYTEGRGAPIAWKPLTEYLFGGG